MKWSVQVGVFPCELRMPSLTPFMEIMQRKSQMLNSWRFSRVNSSFPGGCSAQIKRGPRNCSALGVLPHLRSPHSSLHFLPDGLTSLCCCHHCAVTDVFACSLLNSAGYGHHAYLTYKQSTSWEVLDWMKHKLESRLLGEISVTSDMQMPPPYVRKRRETKEPLDESERGE